MQPRQNVKWNVRNWLRSVTGSDSLYLTGERARVITRAEGGATAVRRFDWPELNTAPASRPQFLQASAA